MGTLNKVSLTSLVKKKTTPSAGEGRSTSAGHVVVNSNSNNTAKVSPAAGGLSLVGNYSIRTYTIVREAELETIKRAALKGR